MFLIKQLECLYCDVKNPNRLMDRDQICELDAFKARSREDAKEIILEILAKNGGLKKLGPKILSNDSGNMWIECDQPYKVIKGHGFTDIKCLAIQIKFFEESEESTLITHEMASFAEALGPKFSL